MNTYTIHKSNERGASHIGWLNAKFSFSFANYYNPERMKFGSLRVLNNDIIAPGSGFDTHCHENFEIITIPLAGALRHKDDAGNAGVVRTGEVQVMSAGSGICHSEHNASDHTPLELFQIWIETKEHNVKPRYQQAQISDMKPGKLKPIVSHIESNEALTGIYSNTQISLLNLDAEQQYIHRPDSSRNGLFIMVIEGHVSVSGNTLEKRDSIEAVSTDALTICARSESRLLLIEVPL